MTQEEKNVIEVLNGGGILNYCLYNGNDKAIYLRKQGELTTKDKLISDGLLETCIANGIVEIDYSQGSWTIFKLTAN